MTFSLHSATVPAMLQVMRSVAGLLDKGEAWCRAKGLPDTALTQARLADDMWPFAHQIRSCWTHSAQAIEAAASGDATPDFSEPPHDFAGLRLRVADAIAVLESVQPDAVNGAIGRDVCFRVGDFQLDFVAEDYLMTFALPNFYFHATTAYAILRNQGVDVGKRDFLGAVKVKG